MKLVRFDAKKCGKITHQPLPECLPFVPWWGFVIRIRLDLSKITLEVHVLWGNRTRAVVEASAQVQDRPGNEKDVISNESSCVPFAFEEDAPSAKLKSKATVSLGNIVEHAKVTHETDDNCGACSIPSRIWLEICPVWKGLAVNALDLHTFVEAEVCHRNTKPCH